MVALNKRLVEPVDTIGTLTREQYLEWERQNPCRIRTWPTVHERRKGLRSVLGELIPTSGMRIE